MEYLRPATPDDLVHVYENMRDADRDECLAMGHHPLIALLRRHK